MKRIWSILFALSFVLTASGQVTEAISIDLSTFKAINTDALTGVNIDKIGLDSSRRPCARIKMKVNRMTREEVEGLELKILTNSELTKCKTADYENGLIIEMTAKSAVRFYLQHSKFGQSNEVTVDLEENKEYYIEASLNQQFSINIASNVEDADVYIDNIFKGKTNSNYILTVEDMLAGEHELKILYAGSEYTQNIIISSAAVYFKQDVNLAAAKMQYLTIITTPKNALVEVNGKVVENSADGANAYLSPGAFYYTVSANNYHSHSGTGVMRGEKITLNIDLKPAFGYLSILADSELEGAQVYVNNSQRGTLPLAKNIILQSGEHTVRIIKSMYKMMESKVQITDGNISTIKAVLQPNFANVTLISEDNAEIWVDNAKQGVGRWSGRLEIGSHSVECRKQSHKSSVETIAITSSASVERRFKALTPIYGAMNITSSPMGATITIDGQKVGTTPLVKSDVLVGKRTISISKAGYNTVTAEVGVTENSTVEVSPTLTKEVKTVSTPKKTTPTTTTTKQTKTSSVKKQGSKIGNIFQLGTGLEYGLGTKHMVVTVPVDLRFGRNNQLFNFIVFGEYGFTESTIKEDENDTEYKPEISVTQWSVGGKARLNVLRNWGKNKSTLFAEVGAKYNFNTKSTFTTGPISYNSSSYNEQLDSYSKYEGELVHDNSLSGRAAIGMAGSFMELSLYAAFNLTPTFNPQYLSEYVVVDDFNQGTTTLADYPDVNKLFGSKFNIGLALRIYFGK